MKPNLPETFNAWLLGVKFIILPVLGVVSVVLVEVYLLEHGLRWLALAIPATYVLIVIPYYVGKDVQIMRRGRNEGVNSNDLEKH